MRAREKWWFRCAQVATEGRRHDGAPVARSTRLSRRGAVRCGGCDDATDFRLAAAYAGRPSLIVEVDVAVIVVCV